ncbi:MAG: hypothetical protein IPJ54_06420 [Saprospiraceae bacterium]|nr:hypothetical protein [Saprospiraceae bacterium]
MKAAYELKERENEVLRLDKENKKKQTNQADTNCRYRYSVITFDLPYRFVLCSQ